MLEIRRVNAGDAEALLEIMGDPEVAYWLRPAGVSGAFTLAECEEIIARKLAHWTAHGIGMSLAFSEGRCVGRSTIDFNRVDGRAELEIGWAVASDMWRRGIATELGRHALHTATDAGFSRVVAFTRNDNVASQGVMQRLGLRYERDFIYAGHPHVLYATS